MRSFLDLFFWNRLFSSFLSLFSSFPEKELIFNSKEKWKKKR